MRQSETRRQSGPAGLDEREIRTRLQGARERATLRALGEAIGVTHYTIRKFLQGDSVRPSTLRRMTAWLDGGTADGLALRDVLRRLARPLPARHKKQLVDEVANAISGTFKEAGLDAPEWIRRIASA